MIALDKMLLHQARRAITAANVHRLKELIFAYEQAVTLHNVGWRGHIAYQDSCERELRAFVIKQARRPRRVA
jgi:hypothetical protein